MTHEYGLSQPQKNIDSWEDSLEFEVMEDYLGCAEMMSRFRDHKTYMEEMREHFEKLKSFIRTQIEAAEKRGERRMFRPQDIAEFEKESYEKGAAAEREKVLKIVEGMNPHLPSNKTYDGNSLESAGNHYQIAAAEWSEIIRFEDGITRALVDLKAALTNPIE